jgi:hypothetical protein
VINTTGAETGVTVNGIPATVSGNSFVANHVPLQQGNNTITIRATDANGLTAATTRSVSTASGNYLRIVPNVESGTAPFDISFHLDGSFAITNPAVTCAGSVQLVLTAVSATEYSGGHSLRGDVCHHRQCPCS